MQKWIHVKKCFIEVEALKYKSVVPVTQDAEGEESFRFWSQSLGSIARPHVMKMKKRKRRLEEEEEEEKKRRGEVERQRRKECFIKIYDTNGNVTEISILFYICKYANTLSTTNKMGLVGGVAQLPKGLAR